MSPETSKFTYEKIVRLDKLEEILRSYQREGKTVGLITGVFDILHVGHIRLVRFAKKNTDILVVGVEQDETVKLSKGPKSPVNSLAARCDVLSALYSVDYIFAIPSVFKYGTNVADEQLAQIYRRVMPDFLITNITVDTFWERKRISAQDLGIGFLGQVAPKDNSSSLISQKIQEEI